jgi:hypothetical protein
VEPDNLVPTNDDAALDTNEERGGGTSSSETATEWFGNFLSRFIGRKSRPVDVPSPEENFKTLDLHKGEMDIDNFIRWVEDVRKYPSKHSAFSPHLTAVEVLNKHKTLEEIMKLLISLRSRSDWKGAEETTRGLLSYLALSYYKSPEALLSAWLKLKIDPNNLYHLLYPDGKGVLWPMPDKAVMWLRYNKLLVAKNLPGAMTVEESFDKLLGSPRLRTDVEKLIQELGKSEMDKDLLLAAKKLPLPKALPEKEH